MAHANNWAKIETLFHGAMARPWDQRERYLKEQTENADERRAALRLVHAAELSTGFMHTSVEVEPNEPSLQIGDRIGHWQIVQVLGLGGMGEVYRVERKGGEFTQSAALKLIRGNDANIRDHFNRERQMLARLEHANIGRLIDGGDAKDWQGRPYMVVELVEGEPLTDFAKKGHLSEASRLGLFARLCRAVGHAHARLTLHCDIKPGNVLVNQDHDVKLIDFGVARFLGDDEQQVAPLTVAYAAPEQLIGNEVTTATDTYALGKLLFELLTGQRHDREVDLETCGLSADLQAVLAKCLQEAPADRYGSADALREDVEHYLRREPVQARQGGSLYRLGKLVSRYRMASAALALFVTALVAGLFGTWTMAERAKKQTELTQAALVSVEIAADVQGFEAKTLAGYRYMLQSLYGGEESEGDVIDPAQIDRSIMKMAVKAGQGFRDGDVRDGFLLYSIGQHFLRRRDFELAVQSFSLGEAAWQDGKSVENELLHIYLRDDYARALEENGQGEPAAVLARQVVKEMGENNRMTAQDLIQPAQIVAANSEDPADTEFLQQTLQTAIAEFDKETGNLAGLSFLYNQLGVLHLRAGNYAGVADAFEQAFAYETRGRVASPDDTVSATNLAQLLIRFRREGNRVLEYLPAYIQFTKGEFGDDPVQRGFMRELLAEAAQVEEKWTQAQSEAALAVPLLQAQRKFRIGLYYRAVAIGARSSARLGQIEQAKAQLAAGNRFLATDFADETKILETDRQAYHSAACELGLADAVLSALQENADTAKAAFQKTLPHCQQINAPTDELDEVTQGRTEPVLATIEAAGG
jgi:hypothetical protein